MKKHTRDFRISAIRMLCTSTIVLLHISQQLERLNPGLRVLTDWLNLSLVMFFAISAFLYSRRQIKNVLQWYLHRYLELLIPSVLVGVGALLYFGTQVPITWEKVCGTVLSCIGLHCFAPNPWMFEQLWFLSYILFFYLSVPLIQKIDCEKMSERKFWMLFIGTVVFAQVLTVALEWLTGIPMLSTGVMLRAYLPYFVFRRYDINGQRIRPVMWFSSAISVIAIIIISYLRYLPETRLPWQVLEIMFIYTQTLAGFTLFYWLYKALSFLKRYTMLLQLSDRFSYEVYLTHCLFIGYSTSLIWKMNSLWLGILAALVMTALSSVAAHYLSQGIKRLFRIGAKPKL